MMRLLVAEELEVWLSRMSLATALAISTAQGSAVRFMVLWWRAGKDVL
jgi:hypothetical protein